MHLYIDIGTRYTSKLVQYIIGIRTEARQKVNAVHCSRGIYLCLFDCKALFVCVKGRTYLRMAIPAYCFSIFGSIFGALFCLLIKKLILQCYRHDHENVKDMVMRMIKHSQSTRSNKFAMSLQEVMNGVLDFWCKLSIFDESSQTCPKCWKKKFVTF